MRGVTATKKTDRIGSRDDYYRFAGWISERIESWQPDTDIQKLLSNGNRIRISETLLPIFWGLRLFEKVARCTIIHLLSSEASLQPSVPFDMTPSLSIAGVTNLFAITDHFVSYLFSHTMKPVKKINLSPTETNNKDCWSRLNALRAAGNYFAGRLFMTSGLQYGLISEP